MQKARLKEFQKKLQEQNIDAVVFYNLRLQEFDSNFFYFSDYDGLGFLVIPKKKVPFLIVPEMESIRAKNVSSVKIIVAKKKLVDELKNRLGKIKKLGIDGKGMTLAFFERFKRELKELGVRYQDISDLCVTLRAVKTEEELRRIKKACKITDAIFSRTLYNFSRFRTEADVAAFMINEANKLGFSQSFKPIVASGKNASEPHHGSRPQKIRQGFCVIDFGIRYMGYCSDMSRTLYVGKPSEKEVELYNKVLNAQVEAIKSLSSKVECDFPDKIVRDVLGKHSKNFIHGLGHGVGLDIHEMPVIPKPNSFIQKGMVFTIEPGVYIKDRLGIRIEDVVAITEKGRDVLTKMGKNLLVVPNKH